MRDDKCRRNFGGGNPKEMINPKAIGSHREVTDTKIISRNKSENL